MQCRTWNTGTFCGRDSKCGELEQEEGDNRKYEQNIVEEIGLASVGVNDDTIIAIENSGFHKEENETVWMNYKVDVTERTDKKWRKSETTQFFIFHEYEDQSNLPDKEETDTFTFEKPEFEIITKALTENIGSTSTTTDMFYPSTKVLSLPSVI